MDECLGERMHGLVDVSRTGIVRWVEGRKYGYWTDGWTYVIASMYQSP